jgi:HrpA-like RNA helicase
LAETCLTFPNCDVVIDSGLKKTCKYNYDSNLYEEVIEYISQDSCIQRSGRCGRGNIRGVAYRVFSEDIFNMMDKFRKPDIEVNNIELIILKLFENDIVSEYAKNQIEEKGYLDFLSQVNKDKFDKIYQKLLKYNALEKDYSSDKEKITTFGIWAMKANMDIELGYYFDRFIDQYQEDINRECVFQLLNIISTSDNYNCELFYTDIDPDKFKFNLIDNNRNSKTLVDFSKLISENIINKALDKYNKDQISNEIEEEEIKQEQKGTNQIRMEYIEYIHPYYLLFKKLEEIYSP